MKVNCSVAERGTWGCCFAALPCVQAAHPEVQQEVFDELVVAGLAAAGEMCYLQGLRLIHSR